MLGIFFLSASSWQEIHSASPQSHFQKFFLVGFLGLLQTLNSICLNNAHHFHLCILPSFPKPFCFVGFGFFMSQHHLSQQTMLNRLHLLHRLGTLVLFFLFCHMRFFSRFDLISFEIFPPLNPVQLLEISSESSNSFTLLFVILKQRERESACSIGISFCCHKI